MSVFKLVNGYEYDGQGMTNVYHYVEAVAGVGTAESLCDAFIEQVLPVICEAQSGEVTHLFVAAKNLSLVSSDNHVTSLTQVYGQRTGSGMPPHDCMTFQMLVESTRTRMGRKAIGGVSEADFDKGKAFGASIGTTNNVADAISRPLEEIAGVDFWFPVIYRANGIFPGTSNIVNGGRFSAISTQNTRKYYTSAAIAASAGPADKNVQGDINGLPPDNGVYQLAGAFTTTLYPEQPIAFIFDNQETNLGNLPIIT